MGGGLGGDVATGAGTVVHDEGLSEDLLELLADHAGEHIARPARRERDQERDRLGRIGLRGRTRGRQEHREAQQGGTEQQSHRVVSPTKTSLARILGRRVQRRQTGAAAVAKMPHDPAVD